MDGVACSIRLFICFLCSNGRRDPFSSTFHQPSFLKRSQRPTLFYLSAALISQTVADTPSLLPFRTFLFSNGRRDPFSSTFQPLSLLKRSQTPTLFYLSAAFFPQTINANLRTYKNARLTVYIFDLQCILQLYMEGRA